MRRRLIQWRFQANSHILIFYMAVFFIAKSAIVVQV
eukprot:COSAG02_NODE_64160_length_261_cov_0.641975_1_plen_35_part_01